LDIALEVGGWSTILAYVRDGFGVGLVCEAAVGGADGLVVRPLDAAAFPPIEARLICRRGGGGGGGGAPSAAGRAWRGGGRRRGRVSETVIHAPGRVTGGGVDCDQASIDPWGWAGMRDFSRWRARSRAPETA